MKKKLIALCSIFVLVMMAGSVNATYMTALGEDLKDRKQDDALGIAKFIEGLVDVDSAPYVLGDSGLKFLTKIDLPNLDSDGYSIKTKDGGSEGQWFTPESVPEGLDVDFVIVKAGSGNGNNDGGYSIFLSNDNDWDTFKLSGHGIPHISFWAAPDYSPPSTPPGGGAQVPEPATIFLLGSGLLGLFGYRKKFWKPKN